MKQVFLWVLFGSFLTSAFAQIDEGDINVQFSSSNSFSPAGQSDVLDGIYVRDNVPNRRPITYPQGSLMREADLMWTRSVWRRIDLRQKINHPLRYPDQPINARKSLFDVIKSGVLETGTITAYSPGPLNLDDGFTTAMTLQDLENLLIERDTVWTEPINGGPPEPTMVETYIESKDIIYYELKEDWFIDKARGVMECRIVGICPYIEVRDAYGEVRGVKPLFWIYFPQARFEFSNAEVFLGGNDMAPLSYDDLFYKRRFSSTITKVSNVYGREISEYKQGIDALLEAQRLHDEMFNMEHDLFSY
ncbi:MAG: gliding motility protein GldN [Salibacteraceae bacterium]